MAQTGLILVPLLLLSIVILVQSRSPEICNSKSEVKLLASDERPPRHEWIDTIPIKKKGLSSDPERKKKCREECEKKCLEVRTGCVSFASRVFALACICWEYKNLPDFGPNVPIEKATYLNGWCMGEWFSFGMPL